MLVFHLMVNTLIILNIILIGGILPLIERKYLSLTKRRVGPKHLGYKGRLQFIADALKMFLKGCFIPAEVNKFFFIFWPSVIFSICLFFWINTYWGTNLTYFEVEYNVLLLALLSICINTAIMFAGYFSKNKYALLGSIRSLILFFCFELLLAFFFLTIFALTKSFHLMMATSLQYEYPLFMLFVIIINFVIILILIEVTKAPFDLTEAESELIAGYHVEYGAFFFALFYLGEYFHLFFISVFFVFLFFGFN